MPRAATVWKHRRFLWKYRRPLRALWKHRYSLMAVTGVSVGFLGARALSRTLGR